jgi:hypothetical protein
MTTTTFVTDPFVFQHALEPFGDPIYQPVEFDRVFQITVHGAPPKEIFYEECKIELTDRKATVGASLFPTLTHELSFLLNLDLSPYFTSLDKNVITWTHKLSGQPLMLSPHQKSILGSMVWSVKGLGPSTFPVGVENWIPWLAAKKSPSIQLLKWRDVWLTTTKKEYEYLSTERLSLLQSNVFELSSTIFDKLKDKWPLQGLVELPDTKVLVQGTSDYTFEWAQTIGDIPYVYYVPQESLSSSMIQFKLYKTASVLLPDHSILPLLNTKTGLVKIYAESHEAIKQFKIMLDKIITSDLSTTPTAKGATHQIPMAEEGIIYFKEGVKPAKKFSMPASITSISELFKHLPTFYSSLGF